MSATNVNMLRHTVAALGYRAAKALDGVSPEFPFYQPEAGVRTPLTILAHMSDLLDWAVGLVSGQHIWNNSNPTGWNAEVDRFFAALSTFDRSLTAADPSTVPCERLFQGPIADALTHVGQIAMLRRMAGCPMRGENYFKADITAGTFD